MPNTVLIVDDEQAVCWVLERAFRREGYDPVVAASAEEALRLARHRKPDAVVLDVRLPGMDGLTALGQLNTLTENAPVVVATAHGNLDTAVRAVAAGAFDYLAKPFDLDQALDAVARALRQRRSETAPPANLVLAPADGLIGSGSAMQTVFKRIALVAPRDAGVLITGESGTGKELVARAIHRHSNRREQPYLPVHVAALNPNLVESELFGHARGAFTGADRDRPGQLTLADGGTVFLDELADIPLPVQAKLLRALEHREVLPVGSSRPQELNVRLLSATHADLDLAVAEGRFRHDLYFRLNVFRIHLPPLRDRPEDIPLLAEHFLRRFAPESPPLPVETVKFLQQRPWAGNVRELRNALEHAAIVARGAVVRPEHIPPVPTVPVDRTASDRLREAVRAWIAEQARDREPAELHEALLRVVEPALVEDVLRRVQGNKVAATRWLGLARATVRKLIGRYFPAE